VNTFVTTVPDMSCSHCERAVGEAISALAGVAEVSVDLGSKRVEVVGTDLDAEAIRAAIEEAGYEAA